MERYGSPAMAVIFALAAGGLMDYGLPWLALACCLVTPGFVAAITELERENAHAIAENQRLAGQLRKLRPLVSYGGTC